MNYIYIHTTWRASFYFAEDDYISYAHLNGYVRLTNLEVKHYNKCPTPYSYLPQMYGNQ